MKKFVLTIAVLALFASPALAQTGSMGFASDAVGSSCNITVPTGVPFTIYVVHKSTDGATGSQWRFDPATAHANLIATGNSAGPASLLTIGSPAAGISIAYGGCVSGDLHIWTFNYFTVVGVPNCTYLFITADPIPNKVISVDCNFAEIEVDPGEGIMNPDGTCDCVVGTQQSTWGKVKSLYR